MPSIATGAGLIVIYTVTMFVSALLLFLMEPMFAKMVLPLLGGSPAVWNTAVVFYQVVLLAGYVYAHATIKWLGIRRQSALHGLLVLLPLLVLPIGVPSGWSPPTNASPIAWVLALMLVAVGLPFFVVSTTSPLLQAWFARTGHRAAADPYFLYAASNVGSLLALCGYPLLVEWQFRLAEQSRIWAGGYCLLVVLTLACVVSVWRAPQRGISGQEPNIGAKTPALLGTGRGEPIRMGWRLRWLLLAFVPSSLMLSVTTYLSTDVASIPLLWVLPLGIYLLTFILVFARRRIVPRQLMSRAFPILLVPLLVIMILNWSLPVAALLSLHLLTFFVAAMVCHGALADDRPAADHLTDFYLWLALGGALGGIFNTLVAPRLFTVTLEYPLVLALAALLNRNLIHRSAQLTRRRPHLGLRDPGAVLGLGLASWVLVGALLAGGLQPAQIATGLVFGLPVLLCFGLSRRPIRLVFGIATLLAAGTTYALAQGQVIHAERSFFGISRVLVDEQGGYHVLTHGTTVHGKQSLDPARYREPLTYFYPTGPVGQVFAAETAARKDANLRVAVVGLGTGATACYSRPGQDWTFYEIDPVVERIARDPRYFTYLRDCAPDAAVILGDARLSLKNASDHRFDLMILDAYSSDAIPVHLITREAVALYLDKLAPGGMLAFHISSRYFDLGPVLGNLAHDAGLVSLQQRDMAVSNDEIARGKTVSYWVVMARAPHDLGTLMEDSRWQPLGAHSGTPLWTDDFSSILGVLHWH